jgi:AcrR family transcriptional regulator
MERPPTLREQKSAATRDRIVDAALSLFDEAGYGNTTVDEIAVRAQVGRRTFFHHFPSKEAVFFADTAARHDAVIKSIEQRPHGESPLASLLFVFGELCDRPIDLARSQKIARLVEQDPEVLGIIHKTDVYDFEAKLVECLRARVGDDLAEEELRVITSTALACIGSAWRVQLTQPDVPLRGHFDAMVQACAVRWGGLDSTRPRSSNGARRR